MAAASVDQRTSDPRGTQSLFREINDRVAELSRARPAAPTRFICECRHSDCCATIALSLRAYAQLRDDPARFIVLVGHEGADEEIVDRRGSCLVVRAMPQPLAQPPGAGAPRPERLVSR